MDPARIELKVLAGTMEGQTFAFDARTVCIVGRAKDCHVRLPDDPAHRSVSRYHCLLDINPPMARVRDFGSRNGTFLNGEKIGQRSSEESPDAVDRSAFAEFDLSSGDRIKLGQTELQVALPDPSVMPTVAASTDGAEIQEFLADEPQTGGSATAQFDDYTTVKLLGEGGMGKVFLARHNESGRDVALKTLRPQVAANEQMRAMFMREVDATRALDHPNIVKLIDASSVDDEFYFTLEYCNAGSARDYIDQEGPFSLAEALRLTSQVLDALTHAHTAAISVPGEDGAPVETRGVVHRDLKPDNVFLVNDGQQLHAKVADFGLAKAFDLAGLSGLTATGSAAGTPTHMPRQQLLDYKFAKPPVDVWAAAATLYTMLTGMSPRKFSRGQDPWLTVLQTTPVPIRNRNAAVPEGVASVIDLALNDEAGLHFESAKELKLALESVI